MPRSKNNMVRPAAAVSIVLGAMALASPASASPVWLDPGDSSTDWLGFTDNLWSQPSGGNWVTGLPGAGTDVTMQRFHPGLPGTVVMDLPNANVHSLRLGYDPTPIYGTGTDPSQAIDLEIQTGNTLQIGNGASAVGVDSTLRVTTGATLDLDGPLRNYSVIENTGTLDPTGGFIDNNGVIINDGTFLNQSTLSESDENLGLSATGWGAALSPVAVGAVLVSQDAADRFVSPLDNTHGVFINNGVFDSADSEFQNGSLEQPHGVFINNGTFDNTRTSALETTITNFGDFENNGVIENDRGHIYNRGTFRNHGVINGGYLRIRQTLYNSMDEGNGPGTINLGQDSIVSAFGPELGSQGLINDGLIQYTGPAGGVAVVSAPLTHSGLVDGGDGNIILSGGVSGAGSYAGTVTFEGRFNPGNSPALISAETLNFTAFSALYMEIGGLARGTEYDAIDALSVTLDGLLEIALLDLNTGFSLMAGDTFDLIIADQIFGNFSSFSFAALSGGLGWATNLVTNQFGQMVYQLSVVASETGVPAPGAMVLLVFGLAGCAHVRRRRSAA